MILWINNLHIINTGCKLFPVLVILDNLRTISYFMLHFLWWYCESITCTSSLQIVSLLQQFLVILDNLRTNSLLHASFSLMILWINNLHIINTEGKLFPVLVILDNLRTISYFMLHFRLMILWINNLHIINTEGKLFPVLVILDNLRTISYFMLHFLWWYCESIICTSSIQRVSYFQC